jgi:TonB-linked outer membrane protein, SusC/RagA family
MTKFYLFSRYLTVLFILISTMAWSQSKTVTGKVTAADDGSGLPGVNVIEKGTSNGTVTEGNGDFSISVEPGATLVFSFVGFISQEVVVGNQTTINVTLRSDVTALTEVVVVGYGTQERKEITSAVASVSSEQFNRGNVTTPGQLIQGKVAGLSIVRPGGDPNAGYTIRLRGISTFGANSEPLIVLDGVVGASLENVDPNDIQSMDVLKDASAAAIYGARGSSGVIIVTTKSGKSGRGPYTNVDYNGFVTIDRVANKIDVLSPEEFVAGGGTDFGSSTDWFEELTQTGFSHTHNVSISGASGATTYRAAVNFRDNEGVAKGVNFQRLNTRLNLGHEAINGRLRFNVNLAFNNREQESINLAAFRYAVIYNPTAPVREDPARWGGYFQRDLFDFYNPVALSRQQNFVNERKNILANYRMDFDLLEDLTLSVNYAQDRETGISGSYWSKNDIQLGAGGNGVGRRSTYDNVNQLLEGTATYSRKFDNLNAELLAGLATQKRESEGFTLQVKNFLFDDTGFDNLGFGGVLQGTNTETSSYRNENVLNSAFARLNLSWADTYFLSASVRSESYSGFGKDNKTGTFPAISAGVRISELADLGAVSNLKLRGSWGVTGNLPPSADLALATYTPGNRIDFDGNPLTGTDVFVSLRQSRDPNPTLKWETKTEMNIGLDFGFLQDRITGSVEYYTRKIDDLLYGISIPSGAPNPFSPSAPANVAGFAWANVAQLRAAGFEFQATYNELALGAVRWTPSLNFTLYDKTKIESFSSGELGFAELRLAAPGSPGQNNNQIIRNKVGETLGNMYGPEFLGVDENNEYILSSTNPDDWGVIGNGLPSSEFGFNNTFVYKNFDLNFFLRGVFGHDLYNSYRGFYENRDAASNTWNSVVTDKTPYITSTPTFSSLYVEKANFIRLDNASLGYNLPLNSNVISKVRFYVAGQNLFTITDYTGIDPEVRYSDSENGDAFTTNLAPGLERRNTYFTTRSYTVGVNVSFK